MSYFVFGMFPYPLTLFIQFGEFFFFFFWVKERLGILVQNLNRRTLEILYIDSSKHQLNASYILKKWKLASSGIDYREGERLLNWG